MKPFILPLGLATACVFVAGCTGFEKMKAARDAVDHGLIAGLSASNHFNSVAYSFPRVPAGPYSKIEGLTATQVDDSTNGPNYVFFLGKSQETKVWEVFSCMVRRGDHWEIVPVTLPRP